MASPHDSSSCPPPSPSAMDIVKQEGEPRTSPQKRSAPGVFSSNDVDLVRICLYGKVKGETTYRGIIQDGDPFTVDPDQLQLGGLKLPSNEAYYFTEMEPSASEATQTIRATPNGHWKNVTDCDAPIFASGNITGFRKSFVFYMGKGPDAQETQWFMRVYRLNSELFKNEQNDTIRKRIRKGLLCRVRRGHAFEDSQVQTEMSKKIKTEREAESSSSNAMLD